MFDKHHFSHLKGDYAFIYTHSKLLCLTKP